MSEFDYGAMYRESVSFRVMSIIGFFMGLITVGMIILCVYHYTVAPIDSDPETGWVLAFEAVIMFLVMLLVFSFRRLDIIIGVEGLKLRTGFVSKMTRWEDIESVKILDKPGLLAAGGVKLGLGKSGWVLRAADAGKPVVIMSLKQGKIRELIFSTSNPQELLSVLRSRLGKEVFLDSKY